MKVALLTREYPPNVYGGAGVHVEYLARELARSAEVTVHCWGDDRPPVAGGPTVVAHRPWEALAGPEPYAAALEAFSIDLTMAAGVGGRRARPQPHLVREPRRPPREAGPRDPPRRDGAQPGADAPVEAGAARRRLRAVELRRADGARGRGRDRRRLGGPPRGDPHVLSRRRSGADERDLQRDRRRGVPARSRHRRARAPRDRPGAPVGRLRRPDHAPEGARAPARSRAGDRPGRPARALRRSAGHAGDRPRDRGPDGRGAARRAAT